MKKYDEEYFKNLFKGETKESLLTKLEAINKELQQTEQGAYLWRPI